MGAIAGKKERKMCGEKGVKRIEKGKHESYLYVHDQINFFKNIFIKRVKNPIKSSM